jgi:hypothetical protein
VSSDIQLRRWKVMSTWGGRRGGESEWSSPQLRKHLNWRLSRKLAVPHCQLSNDLPAMKPPSIEKVAPVTKSASAEARKRII